MAQAEPPNPAPNNFASFVIPYSHKYEILVFIEPPLLSINFRILKN